MRHGIVLSRLQYRHDSEFDADIAARIKSRSQHMNWTELTWTSRPSVCSQSSATYFILVGCKSTWQRSTCRSHSTHNALGMMWTKLHSHTSIVPGSYENTTQYWHLTRKRIRSETASSLRVILGWLRMLLVIAAYVVGPAFRSCYCIVLAAV